MTLETYCNTFWDDINKEIDSFHAKASVLQRKRKKLARYENGTIEHEHHEDINSFYRRIYLEALQLEEETIMNTINN